MTYLDLLNELKTLKPEQLNQTVTIHLTEVDEFKPVRAIFDEDGTDVLDSGHVILEVY